MISYESTLEKDFIYLLDYDQCISEYEEQPVNIEYYVNGKKHHYIPDFLAIIDYQKWIFECKPEIFVNNEENLQKFQAARYFCSKNSWQFLVITDEMIRGGFYLRNVKYLTTFARIAVPSEIRLRLLNLLFNEVNPIPISEVEVKLTNYDRAQTLPALFYMTYFHEISMPIHDEPISPKTFIRMNNRKGNDNGQLPFFLRDAVYLEGSGV